MIPQSAIKQWQEALPWQKDYQIELDLIICRTVCSLFNDEYLSEHLSFRGGTAFNKLYFHPQPRFSEDIDLVQINAEPISKTINKIREVLSFLGEPKIKQKSHNNTLIFRFISEIPPVIPIRLKIEINTREHFNVLGLIKHDFSVINQWFSGSCKTTTYHLEELLGTKMRALYQRRKGRDLFDLWKAITLHDVDTEKIISCYKEYIGFVVDHPPTKRSIY